MGLREIQQLVKDNHKGFMLLTKHNLTSQAMAVQNQAKHIITHAQGLTVICSKVCNEMLSQVNRW